MCHLHTQGGMAPAGACPLPSSVPSLCGKKAACACNASIHADAMHGEKTGAALPLVDSSYACLAAS